MSKNENDSIRKSLTPAIRVVIVMLAVTGVAYPLSLVAIGQGVFPLHSKGSIVNLDGSPAGSMLIAQEFTSAKFFHSRPPSDSASGVDPHITPQEAFTQVPRISNATEIPINHLNTLVELDIERGRLENLVAFAPDYVNVLRLNLNLVRQYPEFYGEFLEARGSNNIQSK